MCNIHAKANLEVRGRHIFQFIPTRASELTLFSREGGIENFVPNGWVVLRVLNSKRSHSGKRMAKIRKWLVCTSLGQDVHQAQNPKAIFVFLLLLLWLVPDVDKWYRTLGSGEGCLPTSSSVCTLSHSGAHCSVQCSSG